MKETEPLNFQSVLSRIEGSYKGSVDELDALVAEAFTETVKRTLSTGKVGKMTLTLGFSRVDETRIEIKGEVTTKLPEPRTDSSVLYHDERGDLFAEDPRQKKLPFASSPLRQINKGEAA
jgi:hypothetical protein